MSWYLLVCATNPRSKSLLGIFAYLRRMFAIKPALDCKEYLRRNGQNNPIPVLIIALHCTQIIRESKLFSANIRKKSTTEWFTPCAKLQFWINTYFETFISAALTTAVDETTFSSQKNSTFRLCFDFEDKSVMSESTFNPKSTEKYENTTYLKNCEICNGGLIERSHVP